MKKLFVIMIALTTSVSVFSQNNDVVDIAIGSADHTTLVAAVQAADLAATLKSEGPFTVFAPTNDAFAKLPAGTVESLLEPANKDQLAKILTYHVISGNLDAASVIAAINEGNGNVELTTVSGGKINASIENGRVKLTDESGGSAFVTATDLKGSNGVIHVIDGVVLPR